MSTLASWGTLTMAKHSFKPGCFSQIFFYLGAYIIFSAWRTDYLIGILIAIPFIAVGVWLASSDRQKAMQDLDKLASWTLENALAAAKRGEPLPVTLYLRPFELTNRLIFSNPHMAPMMTPAYYSEQQTLDLETMVAEELMGSMPLIALGEPGEHIGAGRLLSTEEDWQQSIKTMAMAARRILILPSTNAGSKWELQWLLKAGQLGKCYFLMPPQPDQADTDMQQYWSNTTQRLKEIGIELPPYRAEGQIYTVDNQGHVTDSHHINLFLKDSIAKAIKALELRRINPVESDLTLIDNHENLIATPTGQSTKSAEKPSTTDNASIDRITVKPAWRKPTTVSYFLIAAVFIVLSIAFNSRDNSNKGTVEQFVPEHLKEHITPDYLDRLNKPPPAPTASELRPVMTSAGISMLVPGDWEQQTLDDLTGILVRPATGSLQCILYSIDFSGEPTNPDEFIAELDADTIADGLQEQLAEQFTNLPITVAVEVENLRFDAQVIDNTASINFLMQIVMSSTTGVSLRQETFAEGRRLLHNGLFVYAQCDMGLQPYTQYKELLRKMLDSIKFPD